MENITKNKRKPSSKMLKNRDRLIEAAGDLFYKTSIEQSAISDIANAAKMPAGNVYYYFKTKDELVDAVLEKHIGLLKTAYANLNDTIHDPRDRLIQALSFYERVAKDYTQHGCPTGNLVIDLLKYGDQKRAATLFDVFIEWAKEQFVALGHDAMADRYAASLVAGVQGGALLASSRQTEACFSFEIERMINWVRSLPNTHIHAGKVSGVSLA